MFVGHYEDFRPILKSVCVCMCVCVCVCKLGENLDQKGATVREFEDI